MNAAQNEAAEKIKDLMREHFDAGLCVLRADPLDEEKDDAERRYMWHGGSDTAIGLCVRLKAHFLSNCEEVNEEE